MKESKYYKLIGEEVGKYYAELGKTDAHCVRLWFDDVDNTLEDGRKVTQLSMFNEVYMRNETSEKPDYSFCTVLNNGKELIGPENFETEEEADKFYEQILRMTKDELDYARRTRNNSDQVRTIEKNVDK